MIARLAVAGYRSLRDLRVELAALTVVTGANGSGKSSLYRSLRLLAAIAQGRAVPSLALEGGLPSTLWAGPETIARSVKAGTHPVQGLARKDPVSLRLGFAADDYGYAIDLGLPPPVPPTMFSRDPQIKAESLWFGQRIGRANEIARRRGPGVHVRGADGTFRAVHTDLTPVDSMLTHCADPREAPELLELRERLRGWRFYDHLRTDADAPARRRQVGTYTPVLADDGADLAAAVQTILEIGADDALAAAIDDAFPGSSVSVTANDGLFELAMRQHGLLRPLAAAELSDGTLRYLLLVAALLTPRPPELMILNEPETSLHPDLLPPLGRLIADAAGRSQVVVVTHAAALTAALHDAAPDACEIALVKEFGETVVPEAEPMPWTWPQR